MHFLKGNPFFCFPHRQQVTRVLLKHDSTDSGQQILSVPEILSHPHRLCIFECRYLFIVMNSKKKTKKITKKKRGLQFKITEFFKNKDIDIASHKGTLWHQCLCSNSQFGLAVCPISCYTKASFLLSSLIPPCTFLFSVNKLFKCISCAVCCVLH